jgi:hypothetical protein
MPANSFAQCRREAAKTRAAFLIELHGEPVPEGKKSILGLTGSRWLKEKSRPRRPIFWGDVTGRCQERMESTSWSGAARGTRSVFLNARATQTGKAVRLKRTLPGEELLLR